ncbi:MAG: 7-cyano-7-deazaguanine synthase [Desulfovibrionaceae bacterium]|nr:7-cyano-7-deazaguanine synthase [Desulfovibrionaceae bacterium]
MRTSFLAFSGGLDSTTLLAHLLAEGHRVIPVFFNYGSRHNPFEEAAAARVASHYEVKGPTVDLRDIFSGLAAWSALMAGSGKDIPTGPGGYQEPGSLAATLVPGRNLLMASILSSRAEAHALQTGDVTSIALATHGGDHALYPDCRPGFVDALSRTIREGTENRVGLLTPFCGMSKTDIVRRGIELKAPYHLTRSCYQDRAIACGKCGTCRERLAAFEAAGVPDPVPYEGSR